MTHEDERHHFIWTGTDREKDIAALADTIAAAVPGLCSHDGSIARLDENGGLSPVNLATFCSLIEKYVCGVRVIKNGTGWRYDFYPFAFAPKPRTGPPTMANPNPDAGSEREPDSAVLDRIYRHELVLRLPKVVT